jgi:crotonobetainyl-CoA:carnitine CoA-transferase CaiB-like acyl-CoA transferase
MLARRPVLELGGGHAIGYAGRLLRLAGAPVLKAEPDGGDPVRASPRSWTFLTEGKRIGSTYDRRWAPDERGAGPISAIRGTEELEPVAALAAPGSPPPPGLPAVEVPAERDAALDWAASGAMALTGEADGAPRCSPGWQAAHVTGAAAAAALVARILPWWSGEDPLPPAEAAASLGWRAAAQGLTRHGRTSCGGRTKLLLVDGIDVAAGLPRPEDVALLEAWSRQPLAGDPWCAVAHGFAHMGAYDGVERAQLLGLPFALAASPDGAGAQSPFSWCGTSSVRPSSTRPLVVDLTSLWAGPLCTALLARAGARVIRVESPRRPDPTRWSAPALWQLLDGRKDHVEADLATADGRLALRRLVDEADVVVESTRPRVLDQLGLGADTMRAERPELLWVSITGYGRTGEGRDRVALGDDAAAAGGIVALTGSPGRTVFCADAYADPVTGTHAAFGALAALASGAGGLLDVAMADVVGHLVADAEQGVGAAVADGHGGWVAVSGDDREPVAPPRLALWQPRG